MEQGVSRGQPAREGKGADVQKLREGAHAGQAPPALLQERSAGIPWVGLGAGLAPSLFTSLFIVLSLSVNKGRMCTCVCACVCVCVCV